MLAIKELLEQASHGGCYDSHDQTEPNTYCDGHIKAETLKRAKAEYAALENLAREAKLVCGFLSDKKGRKLGLACAAHNGLTWARKEDV